jgi:hypothetical protein
MTRHHFHVALVIVAMVLQSPSIGGQGSRVQALFDLDSVATGPFPSDWFTAPDHTNNTHRRVALPLPNCELYVSDGVS